MHSSQRGCNNPYSCTVSEYHWGTDGGFEVVSLSRTKASTPYIPGDMGAGWHAFENGAKTTREVYRRVDSLFRNRLEEIWRAAVRSVYEFRRLAEPVLEVMTYFLRLGSLRKNVWTIISEGIAKGASLALVSSGCRLHAEGYRGLYTRDVQLRAVLNATTDVDPIKLTAWSGRTVTAADPRAMIRAALCSDAHFGITPEERARGVYKLPRLIWTPLPHLGSIG